VKKSATVLTPTLELTAVNIITAVKNSDNPLLYYLPLIIKMKALSYLGIYI
jgi:hypothetical protein